MAKNEDHKPFREQLIRALEHFEEPEWLGMNSPLAAPYFLGERLLRQAGNMPTFTGRGQALRSLIREAAQILLAQEKRYYYDLLHLTYFRSQSIVQICQTHSISRATYYRHRHLAVDQLEEVLVAQVNPALRLEEIPVANREILGQEKTIEDCWGIVQKGHSLTIIGSGGTGKTTIGAQLANKWPEQSVFWLTMRPGLNDQLTNLLFSLGYFWHLQGASTLWLQLLASTTAKSSSFFESESLLGLVRHCLDSLGTKPQLLCFDDVDLLFPQELERHAQILSFLQALSNLTPIVLMGRHVPPINVPYQATLTGLSGEHTRHVLESSGISLSNSDASTIQTYIQGNPRLLDLFITLHQAGESTADVLQRMSSTPSVEFMASRIWQLLTQEEQELLTTLCVFRQLVPRDALEAYPSLARLTERNLVQSNSSGGVQLLPSLKDTIYYKLAPEVREAKHRRAATVRAERGQYTAAAYHYIRGGEVEAAVWLWYMHRRQEINQGQGSTALSLFEELSTSHLSGPVQEILVLLRSELRMLIGDYTKIRNDIQSILWQTPLLRGRAKRIAGDVSYEKSQFDKAIHAYQEGLESLISAGSEMALLYKEIGKVHGQRRDLGAAWRASLFAQYEVENLKGNIQSDMGNYTEAQAYYEKALELAVQLGHVEGEGKTRTNLAWMLKQQGEFDLAQQHWSKASECYKQVGNLIWQAGIKINQAVAYTETDQTQKAVPLLEESLSVFEILAHPRGKAKANANLAEAHFRLANFDQAVHFAWQSMEDEEPSVMAASFHTLAEIMLARKEFSQAIIYCQKSVEWADKTFDNINAGLAWRTLGKVYLYQGKYLQAKEVLQQAIELFQNMGLEKEVEITRSILRQIPRN